MNAVVGSDLTIDRFEAGDIDPDSFGHESHVYMGWLYVRELGAGAALPRFDAAIRRLVTLFGAADKYHATITWFFILLIAERFEDGESWQQFNHRNAELIVGCKPILSHYYSEGLLFSDRARTRFVLPDSAKRVPLFAHPC